MRTTIDLPSAVHKRAQELAAARGLSLSAVVGELVARGLIQLDAPAEIGRDARSGFPVVSVGRKVTSEQVAAVLDDE